MIRGKNVKMTVIDIAEGFTIVNPILLKSLDEDTLKELHAALHKHMVDIRREKFPFHDPEALRLRNMKLQRLNNSDVVVRAFAKTRRILLI